MAKARVPTEWIETFLFVIMERLDAKSTDVLARKIGYIVPSDVRNLRRWAEGSSAPDFEATLYLLRAAGLLRDKRVAEFIPTAEARVKAYFDAAN